MITTVKHHQDGRIASRPHNLGLECRLWVIGLLSGPNAVWPVLGPTSTLVAMATGYPPPDFQLARSPVVTTVSRTFSHG